MAILKGLLWGYLAYLPLMVRRRVRNLSQARFGESLLRLVLCVCRTVSALPVKLETCPGGRTRSEHGRVCGTCDRHLRHARKEQVKAAFLKSRIIGNFDLLFPNVWSAV